MKYLEKRLTALTAWRFSLLLIFGLNLLLRSAFILYGYISHDEGIAFYNTKLAYSGLVPFIDYNGWNSLVNDYFFGLTRLFIKPDFLTQRLFAACLALTVFFLTIKVSRNLGSQKASLVTTLLLTFGSLTYTYFSNLPYSTQSMTFFLILSLYFLSQGLRYRSFLNDSLAMIAAVFAMITRSQALPLAGLIWLYLIINHRRSLGYIIRLSGVAFFSALLLYAPFLTKSVSHTLYAVFWPFFANKILLYVADIPARSVGQLFEFAFLTLRDYGLLLIPIGSMLITKRPRWKSAEDRFLLLCLGITGVFFITALIHHPADAFYLYPAVPVFSIISAHYLVSRFAFIKTEGARRFWAVTITLTLLTNIFLYPHFKVMKTTSATLDQTPHTLLKEITSFVENNTTPTDTVISFYLPAIAELDRNVPINLNEGPGSISILDDRTARNFHLTTVEALQDLIRRKEVKMIIFTDTFTYYFGRDKNERSETLELINQNYTLIQEFPDFRQIDGSKALSLQIYRLSE